MAVNLTDITGYICFKDAFFDGVYRVYQSPDCTGENVALPRFINRLLLSLGGTLEVNNRKTGYGNPIALTVTGIFSKNHEGNIEVQSVNSVSYEVDSMKYQLNLSYQDEHILCDMEATIINRLSIFTGSHKPISGPLLSMFVKNRSVQVKGYLNDTGLDKVHFFLTLENAFFVWQSIFQGLFSLAGTIWIPSESLHYEFLKKHLASYLSDGYKTALKNVQVTVAGEITSLGLQGEPVGFMNMFLLTFDKIDFVILKKSLQIEQEG